MAARRHIGFKANINFWSTKGWDVCNGSILHKMDVGNLFLGLVLHFSNPIWPPDAILDSMPLSACELKNIGRYQEMGLFENNSGMGNSILRYFLNFFQNPIQSNMVARRHIRFYAIINIWTRLHIKVCNGSILHNLVWVIQFKGYSYIFPSPIQSKRI